MRKWAVVVVQVLAVLLAWLHITGDVPLGDLLVAAGTLLLAGFTWQLARQTRVDVGLTRQSVEAIDMFLEKRRLRPGGALSAVIHSGDAGVLTEDSDRLRQDRLGRHGRLARTLSP